MNMIKRWYLLLFTFWMRWPQQIRYLLVGGYNTVFSYALYAFLLWLGLKEMPQLALLFSFVLSSVNSFWTQKIYVFHSHGRAWPEYVRCLMTWGVSYVLNAFLLALLLALNWNPYVAQFVALVIITVNSYFLLKYMAFRSTSRS